MYGRSIKLSLPRKMVIDALSVSRSIPTVPVERRIDISCLTSRFSEIKNAPLWSAIFLKAFGLVANQMPELRRAYISYPWPRLYEYPVSVGVLMIQREFDGEPCIIPVWIKDPASQSLRDLTAQITKAKQGPVESIKHFRHIRALDVLPTLMRRAIWSLAFNWGRQRANFFGTYFVTSVGSYGASTKHPLAPVTAAIGYGAFSESGHIDVSGIFDHRVLDGVAMAKSLVLFERTLNLEILEELSTFS